MSPVPRRYRLTAMLAALLLVTAVLSPSARAWTPSDPPSGQSPWAKGDVCPQVFLIGVRGSGQNDPSELGPLKMGKEMDLYARWIALAMQGTTVSGTTLNLAPYGVSEADGYPAVDAFWGIPGLKYVNYNKSVGRGVKALVKTVTQFSMQCGPTTRFALIGHSQGAEVIEKALAVFTPATQQQIDSIVLNASPIFDGSLGTQYVIDNPNVRNYPGVNRTLGDHFRLPGWAVPITTQVCRIADTVCGYPGGIGKPSHGDYSTDGQAVAAIVKAQVTAIVSRRCAERDVNFAGGAGSDRWNGTRDDDAMTGGLGNDTLIGGRGADTLCGDDDDDFIQGGIDNDVIEGAAGTDDIRGGPGSDLLTGGPGDDAINGGPGTDTCYVDADDEAISGCEQTIWSPTVLEGTVGQPISSSQVAPKAPTPLTAAKVVGSTAPPWLHIGMVGQRLVLSGTPDRPGSDMFHVNIFDRRGNAIATIPVEIHVSDEPLTGDLRWVHQGLTNAQDSVGGLAITPNNSIVVAGNTGGYVPGAANAGGNDLYLATYDQSWNRLWARQLGSGGNENVNALTLDAVGNIYVAGSTTGSLPNTAGSNGGTDAFVVKYDSNGTRLWTKQFGTSATDSAFSIAVGQAGALFVAGQTYGTLPGSPESADSTGSAFVMQLDASGTQQWVHEMGTQFTYATGVVADSTGVFAVGHTNGDGFIARLTTDGSVQWYKALGISNGGAESVVLDGSGQAVFVGSSYLASYTTGGAVGMLSPLAGLPRAVALDTHGNLCVAGQTINLIADPPGVHAGGYDMFVGKFDLAATHRWLHELGNEFDNVGRRVAVDHDGNCYVGGGTIGNMPGASEQNPSTGNTGFVAKFAP